MCLGIPGRLVERLDNVNGMPWGVVEFDGVRREVCLACVADAECGDYVVVHAGLAISRLDEVEAKRVFALIEEIEPGARDEIRR